MKKRRNVPDEPLPDWRSIGYARVSTDEQDLRAQIDQLRKHGVLDVNLYSDKKSGRSTNRPGLEAALMDCRPGDVLVVPSLDRLSRSVEDLIGLSKRLTEEGVELRSLRESIDTTSPVGVFFFHLMAALAQFERSLIGKRTREGLAATVARGTKLGRKPKLTDAKLKQAAKMLRSGLNSAEVARKMDMSGPQLRARIEAAYGKKLWTPKPRRK
jgi:DNA invertase Pin-like site-specific DNA recombinase